MIKVSLSPEFDQYLGRNDLERELSAANLMSLMPTDKGASRAFKRTMEAVSKEYGVKFVVIKETTKDIMWSVMLGRKNLGTYMVIYGVQNAKPLPSFTGSKHRILAKTHNSSEDRTAFTTVCAALTNALTNPGINSYTFHLRVSEYLRGAADVIEPRPTGLQSDKREKQSSYYFLRETYLQNLLAIQHIYDLFNMKLVMGAV